MGGEHAIHIEGARRETICIGLEREREREREREIRDLAGSARPRPAAGIAAVAVAVAVAGPITAFIARKKDSPSRQSVGQSHGPSFLRSRLVHPFTLSLFPSSRVTLSQAHFGRRQTAASASVFELLLV